MSPVLQTCNGHDDGVIVVYLTGKRCPLCLEISSGERAARKIAMLESEILDLTYEAKERGERNGK
jgi:hypothetical protein